MNATLRAAGPGDLELFAALEAEVFSEDPWTPYMIAEELSSPASRYWIATDDSGDVVGYGGAKVGGDQADVMTIACAPTPADEASERRFSTPSWHGPARPEHARSSSMCDPRTRVPSTCTRHGDSSKLAADRATFATPVEEAVEMRASLI